MKTIFLAVSVIALLVIFCVNKSEAACSGSGETWNCASGSTIEQVNSAIASSVDGSIITLAIGSYSWGGTTLAFDVNKGTTLICAVPLACDVNGFNLLWYNWGVSTKLIRISGLDITGTGSGTIWLTATGTSEATLKKFRFDHNRITVPTSTSDVITIGEVSGLYTTIHGVIDHNIFTTTSGQSRWIVMYAQTVGTPWPSTRRMGTADNLFIEDNIFNDECFSDAGFATMDSDGGPMTWVIRHNTFTNAEIGHHGYYWGFPGPSSSEIYDNTTTNTCGMLTDGQLAIKSQGAGEWMVFNNTVTPTTLPHSTEALVLQHYRSFYTPLDNPCDGTSPEDGNRLPLETYRGYPCNRQPGRDATGFLRPQYYWNNKFGDDNTPITMTLSCADQGVPNYCSLHVQANRDYYQGSNVAQTSSTSPFNGTSGTGFGTLARRPTTCTTGAETGGGVGYYATDKKTLYRCSATNTWTVQYKPYAYPHPLTIPVKGCPYHSHH